MRPIRMLSICGLALPGTLLAVGCDRSSTPGDRLAGPHANAATVRPQSTLTVPTDFPSIQEAVNAAHPGDQIRVLSGTYREQVTIDKDLTLTGSGSASTTIRAPARLTPHSFDRTAIVEINNAAKVTMSGFTVTGPGRGSCKSGSLNEGLLVVGGATLDLSSAVVARIHDTPIASCNRSGGAIRIGLPAFIAGPSEGSATIKNVVITDYQFAGIEVAEPGSTATLSDNLIVGLGPSDAVAQFGIGVVTGARATVTRNTVSGNICTSSTLTAPEGGPVAGCGPDPINQFQSIGIIAFLAGAGSVIAKNELSLNDVGIYLAFSSECCMVSQNSMTDNRFFGLIVQDGDNTSSNDRISGGRVGVGVVATAVNATATLRNDVITGTTVAPIQEIACCGFTATAVIEGREVP